MRLGIATALLALMTPPLFASPIHTAVLKGDLPAIRSILAADPAAVNSPAGNGALPIHGAAAVGRVDVLEFLISQKADPNAVDPTGETPLHIAAFVHGGDCKATVLALLAHGADPNHLDAKKQLPLHWAALGKDGPSARAAAECLIPVTKNIDAPDAEGKSALLTAAQFKKPGVAATLIAHGASVVVADPANGATALHWAAQYEDENLARLLLDHGAPVDVRDKLHYTPLHLATFSGAAGVVRLLLDRHADAR
jgi:ankyrin repeat protein